MKLTDNAEPPRLSSVVRNQHDGTISERLAAVEVAIAAVIDSQARAEQLLQRLLLLLTTVGVGTGASTFIF